MGHGSICTGRGFIRTRRGLTRIASVPLLLAVLCFAAGCASPEATRTRGKGRGADTGNRPARVKMHDGSDPFWKTPDLIPAEHVPLDPARQAREHSTGEGL